MRKRIFSSLYTLIIALSLFLTTMVNVNAANHDSGTMVDGSYLTDDDSSKGKTDNTPINRGAYLMDGECSITRSGIGKIYVYAATTSNFEVDYLSTVLYVDRYNEKTGTWGQIDYWQAEDYNTYYVKTTKTMNVEGGYYYRVRATHVAGMTNHPPYDEVTSFTDGIFIK